MNPLMRALYLTRGRQPGAVTLFVPWLPDIKARQELYGKDRTFEQGGPNEQEAWIREFCRTRAKCPTEEANLRIQFWEGAYHDSFGSIFPRVDICALIPKEEADVAILEEPEHLNWFRVPETSAASSDFSSSSSSSPSPKCKPENVDYLGWAHKFRHVIGILHTNYDSYIKKYGMGTSLITAPALNALSSLVIKAYCHRVIRLSGTLTSLVPHKEVTKNVHGVRVEFLEPPQEKKVEGKFAKVYFVGKLIWAKGFEDVLELQERYRAATGEYFEMDIYGGGKDEKAIKRAFFGRHRKQYRDVSPASSHASGSSESNDEKLAEIFDRTESLRDFIRDREAPSDEEASSEQQDNEIKKSDSEEAIDFFGDLSKKTFDTGAETAGCAIHLVEAVLENGLGAFRRRDEGEEDSKVNENDTTPRFNEKKSKPYKPFSLAPRLAAFKWRRQPIPARFLGVKDHFDVRDIPEQQIFLNMSTSEVLCTTSAEALAMGKFVILPKHPSNDFFYQFPNCLAYADLDDCMAKLLYALANQPMPLSEEHRHVLSWEGATERLYEASGIPKRDDAETDESTMDVEAEKAARFHVETGLKSKFVRDLFSGKILKRMRSS